MAYEAFEETFFTVALVAQPFQGCISSVSLRVGLYHNKPLWFLHVSWLTKQSSGDWGRNAESWYFSNYERAADYLERLEESEWLEGDWYQSLSREADY